MKILVLNCGSSSLKYQLIDMETEEVLASGKYERIGEQEAFITHKACGKKVTINHVALDHTEAIDFTLKQLTNPEYKVIESLDEVSAVGHRLVHGGEEFKNSTLITDDVIEACKKFTKLAPLHNPAMLACIEASKEAFPGTPMVAVFDTSFHQSMEAYNFLYPVPYEWYEKYGVRKYGFHGTSHKFINREITAKFGRDDLKVISCHIGSGASICAINAGKVVDTSMGFSPMTGIMMGTRPGDVDPSIIPYMMDEAGMTQDEVMTQLNKHSGYEGVCGKSDSRDVEDGIKAGD